MRDSHWCRNEANIAALSRSVAELSADLARVKAENGELRQALVTMAERLLAAGVLGAQDKRWLSGLLEHYLQPGDTLKTAAARAAHRVVGKVRCQCGATVDDIEGVTDERCPWCGERLQTDR
ncbi:MAG: hypothetical protein ACOX6T_14320 [Myxococcales bacterium]